jgi:hypothetical protein
MAVSGEHKITAAAVDHTPIHFIARDTLTPCRLVGTGGLYRDMPTTVNTTCEGYACEW